MPDVTYVYIVVWLSVSFKGVLPVYRLEYQNSDMIIVRAHTMKLFMVTVLKPRTPLQGKAFRSSFGKQGILFSKHINTLWKESLQCMGNYRST